MVSAAVFMPGFVMWPPMRYTTSMPSVKRMRLRSSATAKSFLTLSTAIKPTTRAAEAAPYPDLQSFRSPTRGRDLLRGFPAELVRANREPLGHLAASQHLHSFQRPSHESGFPEQFRRNHGALFETFGDAIEIHDRVFDAERIVKSALRHAAMQRHLPAFEPTLALIARPRLSALVAPAGLRALARALTAADALLRMLGALGRL